MPPPTPKLSIREQIALKRAEAKKLAPKSSPIKGEFDDLEDASPDTYNKPEEDVDLGRWSVKETIERGRSSGMSPHSAQAGTSHGSGILEVGMDMCEVKGAAGNKLPTGYPLPLLGNLQVSSLCGVR